MNNLYLVLKHETFYVVTFRQLKALVRKRSEVLQIFSIALPWEFANDRFKKFTAKF